MMICNDIWWDIMRCDDIWWDVMIYYISSYNYTDTWNIIIYDHIYMYLRDIKR